MYDKIGEHRWNNIKLSLKIIYPILTDSDLEWRDKTNKSDFLKDIAVRIGIPFKELELIVDNL